MAEPEDLAAVGILDPVFAVSRSAVRIFIHMVVLFHDFWLFFFYKFRFDVQRPENLRQLRITFLAVRQQLPAGLPDIQMMPVAFARLADGTGCHRFFIPLFYIAQVRDHIPQRYRLKLFPGFHSSPLTFCLRICSLIL